MGERDERSRGSRSEEWRATELELERIDADAMFAVFGPPPSPEEQIESLAELVRRYPSYYYATLQLGALEAATGRRKTGRRHLLEGTGRLIEQEPSLPEELDAYALVENLTKNLCHDLALELLRPLVEAYPHEVSLLDGLGGVLVVLGEPEEAIRVFERALELEPGDARHHCNLGWACLAAGRLDPAEVHLGRSLELNPDDEVTRGNVEVLQYLQGEGGTFEDFLLRPLDREELDRMATEGRATELDRMIRQWNHERLEAWKYELCRTREPPIYQEAFKSARAFFEFVRKDYYESAFLYEDLDPLAGAFETLMRALILQMTDMDAELIEEIYAGLLSLYGFLCQRGLVGEAELAKFRSEASALEAGLVEKAERYGAIRRDDSIPVEEKERIRRELFRD